MDILSSLASRAAAGDPALILTAEGSLTAGELLTRAARLAGSLRRRGLQEGATCGLLVADHAAFYTGLCATWLAGGVAVPLDLEAPPVLRDPLLEAADITHVLVDASSPALPAGVQALHVDELGGPPTETPSAADARSVILFTSGSTGVPRGVCHSRTSITQNAAWAAAALQLEDDERLFLNTPPVYTSALCHFLALTLSGGAIVPRQGFHFGTALLDAMTASECTAFGGAPAHLVRALAGVTDTPVPPTLRRWVSSGAHLPQSVIAQARHAMPDVALFTVYGLTEVAGRFCVLPPELLDDKAGSVGRPIGDMSVDVVDDEGRVVPTGAQGEVRARGSVVMKGYLNAPEATAAVCQDGTFLTGDEGHLDEDGCLWLLGRRDDIFKRAGEKVSLLQVQNALQHLDGVRDAAALAVDDDLAGQVPVGFFVPEDGAYRSATCSRPRRRHRPCPLLRRA